MSDSIRQDIRAPIRAGVIGIRQSEKGMFPFDAFEFDSPTETYPDLTLKSPWRLTLSGDLVVSGDADIGGSGYIDSNEIWHEGNDGSGSGLDADLLDGKELNDIPQGCSLTSDGSPFYSDTSPSAKNFDTVTLLSLPSLARRAIITGELYAPASGFNADLVWRPFGSTDTYTESKFRKIGYIRGASDYTRSAQVYGLVDVDSQGRFEISAESASCDIFLHGWTHVFF